MVLEQFIIDADIIWDQVGKTFFENPEAKPGRIMRVQVVNAGIIEDLTGYTLNLGWTSVRDPSKFGLDAFDDIDITKGIFEIEYTSGMLTNIGPLNASLQLVPPGEGRPIESNNFKLTVKNSAINAYGIQGENSFSTLETALVKVNDWNERIDVVEQDFKDRADALDGAYPVRLADVEQKYTLADVRISNIVATAGDGTIPSELSDIRVGKNGDLYLSAGDFTRAASEGRVPKSTLNEVWAHKHATATHTIITTPRIYNGRTLGVSATVTIVESNLYWYMRARLAGKVFNDIKTKKFRVTVRSDKDANIRIRTMNGAAWGSEDGKLGSPESFDVVLNAANKRETSVIFDFSKASYATFYAVSGRELSPYQDVYFSVAMNEGGLSNSAGVYNLSYEVSELVSDKFDDLTASRHFPSATYADSAGTAANATNATNLTGFTPTDYLKKNEINLATPLTVSTYGGSFTGTNTFSKTVYGLITRVTRPEVANPDLLWHYGLISVNLGTLSSLANKRVRVHFDDSLSALKFKREFRLTKSSTNWSIAAYPKSYDTTKFYMTYDPNELYDILAADGRWLPTDNVYLCIVYETSAASTGPVIPAVDMNVSFLTQTITDYNVKTNLQVADLLDGFNPDDYALAADLTEAVENVLSSTDYITCWGDSLTAGGGWTSTIGTLSGKTVYNGGTGGENVKTIAARQGADVMIINNITIPATTDTVLLASRNTDGGIKTAFGHTVTPLLQGGAHVNPVMIDGIEGTLTWTGVDYADMNGTWTFKRSVSGTEKVINRPTAIRTEFDRNKNGGFQIIFIGQNGGYADDADLVNTHKLMMAHSTAKHTIILGLSSGSAASRATYEMAMRKEFGRYFISLREYLSTYGLADAGLTPTQTDLDAMATGAVPPQLLSDTVHYTSATKTVIGNMLYKKMVELNVL